MRFYFIEMEHTWNMCFTEIDCICFFFRGKMIERRDRNLIDSTLTPCKTLSQNTKKYNHSIRCHACVNEWRISAASSWRWYSVVNVLLRKLPKHENVSLSFIFFSSPFNWYAQMHVIFFCPSQCHWNSVLPPYYRL